MKLIKSAGTAVAILLVTTLAAAEVSPGTQPRGRSPLGFGARAGFGIEPDQFVIGAQALTGGILRFGVAAPSVDFGFGDDVTTIAANGDVILPLVSPPGSNTSFYVLAGPTLAYIDPERFDSDLEIGLTLGGGIQLPFGSTDSYNLEARFGLGDIPEFRLMFGILFGGSRR